MFLERSRPGSTGDGWVRGFADPSPAGLRGRPRCLRRPRTRHPRSPAPPTLEGKPHACTWPPRQGRSTPPPPKPGRTPGARPTRRAGHTTPLPRGSSRAPTDRRSAAPPPRSPATSPTQYLATEQGLRRRGGGAPLLEGFAAPFRSPTHDVRALAWVSVAARLASATAADPSRKTGVRRGAS